VSYVSAKELQIPGALELVAPRWDDARGWLTKVHHRDWLESIGVQIDLRESFLSSSHQNVLRGFHYQKPPFGQKKLVTCLQGRTLTALLDLRLESPSYGNVATLELDSTRRNLVYAPLGIAHAFLALEPGTLLLYLCGEVRSPEHEAGIRWNSVNFRWPVRDPQLSERDRQLPLFEHGVSRWDR
jgi:dTDP-4-dehydrorhamnose 3,5-epimerase